jgi:hypothetical protein
MAQPPGSAAAFRLLPGMKVGGYAARSRGSTPG